MTPFLIPMGLTLLVAFFDDLPALPGVAPEDREVVKELELLENMDLAETLDLFVAPTDEPPASTPSGTPDDPAADDGLPEVPDGPL